MKLVTTTLSCWWCYEQQIFDVMSSNGQLNYKCIRWHIRIHIHGSETERRGKKTPYERVLLLRFFYLCFYFCQWNTVMHWKRIWNRSVNARTIHQHSIVPFFAGSNIQRRDRAKQRQTAMTLTIRHLVQSVLFMFIDFCCIHFSCALTFEYLFNGISMRVVFSIVVDFSRMLFFLIHISSRCSVVYQTSWTLSKITKSIEWRDSFELCALFGPVCYPIELHMHTLNIVFGNI